MLRKPATTTVLDLDRVIKELERIEVHFVPIHQIPATAPVIRLNRPSTRDAVNVTLSPSRLLPVEREYRRSSVLIPVDVQADEESANSESESVLTTSEMYAMSLVAPEKVTEDDSSQAEFEAIAIDSQPADILSIHNLVQRASKDRLKRRLSHDKLPSPAEDVLQDQSTAKPQKSMHSCEHEQSPSSSAKVIGRQQLLRRSELLFSSDRGSLRRRAQSGTNDSANPVPLLSGTGQVRDLQNLPKSSNTIGDVLIEPSVVKVGKTDKSTPDTLNGQFGDLKGFAPGERRPGTDQTASRLTYSIFSRTTHETVFYSDVGYPEGHVVLLIPDPRFTRFTAAFLESIAKDLHLRIIIVDRPYRSQPAQTRSTINFAALVAEVFHELHVENYSVLAQARGAAYAMQLVEKFFGIISGVVLLAPSLSEDFLQSSMRSLFVRPMTRRKAQTRLPCLDTSLKCVPRSTNLVIHLSEKDQKLWGAATAPKDIKIRLMDLKAAQIACPLSKLKAKFCIINLRGDQESTLEHCKLLQSWLHDCQLFEWDDSCRIAHEQIWLVKNLMVDVFTLLAAHAKYRDTRLSQKTDTIW